MRSTVLARRNAFKLLEDAEEGVAILKTDPRGDVLNDDIRVSKQLLCCLNAQTVEIVDKGNAGLILEVA